MDEKRDIVVRPVDETTVEGLCALYRDIYGESFPIREVYDARKVLKANREGSHINMVALVDGQVAGHLLVMPAAWNVRLIEVGGFMVSPGLRSPDLTSRLTKAVQTALVEDVLPGLDWSVRYTESTTVHLYSQRVERHVGHVNGALALDLLPAGMGPDALLPSGGRVSCVMGFRERRPCPFSPALPDRYASILPRLALPFGRVFSADGTATGRSTVTAFSLAEAGTAYLTASSGEDLGSALDEVLGDLKTFSSLQLRIPLLPGVSSAVEVARERGFFLGGFLPGWFREGDGLLLQRTAGEPCWEEIHLLSKEARWLCGEIRRDREALA